MFEYLMFENEQQAYEFQNTVENNTLYDNLHLDIVENKLCAISKHFPAKYFKKMNHDRDVATYRGNIFRELGTTDAIKQTENIFARTLLWENMYEQVRNIAHPLQRKIIYVLVLSSYFDLIDIIVDFLSKFSSDGMKKMHDIFAGYLEDATVSSARSIADEARYKLAEHLHLSLSVDFREKRIMLSSSFCGISTNLKDLDSLCSELTGIKVSDDIFITHNEAFTTLENVALAFVLEKNKQLNECVDRVPQISFILDEILLMNQQLAFYYAYHKLIQQLSEKGIPFCFPTFEKRPMIKCEELYDISLSITKIEDTDFVQTGNAIALENEFQGFVLTGANQGGKTTYLRSVGLMIYLSMMGYPIASRKAALYPYKKIECFFCSEEVRETTLSRFEREIKQYLAVCNSIDKDTVVLLNEYFLGTNRQDAVKILQSCIVDLLAKNAIFGCVTHFQEIYGRLGEENNKRIVYLRAEVTGNEQLRSYKIRQAIPDGRAYSETITAKYGLTYKDLLELFHENQRRKAGEQNGF